MHLRNPLNLLAIEIEKFRSYTVIQFLFWLGVLLFPIVLLSAQTIVNDMPPPLPGTGIIYQFPTIWDYMGYMGNWLVWFFFGCVVIFTITSEVNFKTERQTIINGYTRRDYFMAKMSNVVALSIVATLVYITTVLVVGSIYTDDVYLSLIFDNNWAIPRFFLMSIGYLSFAALVATVFRKNGLAVFFYVAYALVFEYIIRGLYMGLCYKLDWLDGMQFAFWAPLNAIEDNMPFPLLKFQQFAQNLSGGDGGPFKFRFLIEASTSAILSIVYISLFVGLTFRSFVKRDV